MSWVRGLWDAYERLFAYLLRLRSLGPNSMLRVRVMTYRGRPLGEGSQALLPGMRVLELHLDNRLISGLGAAGSETVFRLRERIRAELPLLLRAVRETPGPVTGAIGTSLAAVAGRGLGFHIKAVPAGLGSRWLALYMRWLARLYRAQGPAGGRMGPGAGQPAGSGAGERAGHASGHRGVRVHGRAGVRQRRRRSQIFVTWVSADELEQLVQGGTGPAGAVEGTGRGRPQAD